MYKAPSHIYCTSFEFSWFSTYSTTFTFLSISLYSYVLFAILIYDSFRFQFARTHTLQTPKRSIHTTPSAHPNALAPSLKWNSRKCSLIMVDEKLAWRVLPFSLPLACMHDMYIRHVHMRPSIRAYACTMYIP